MYGSLTRTLLVLLARTISEISQPTILRNVRFCLESRNKFSDSTLVSTVDKFEEIHVRYTHIFLSKPLGLYLAKECFLFTRRAFFVFARLLVETITIYYVIHIENKYDT